MIFLNKSQRGVNLERGGVCARERERERERERSASATYQT